MSSNQLSVGDKVAIVGRVLRGEGKIEGIGTELGPDYFSIRLTYDDNTPGFCIQVPREQVVRIDS